MAIIRTMAVFCLGVTMLLPVGAALAQTQQPPQTTETEQAQIKREEKANQDQAKADKAKRKALKAQDKAAKAARKAGTAPAGAPSTDAAPKS